jgi:precorrin-6y C5,15-methyltransferase (decarboxylating) CbiE subunit
MMEEALRMSIELQNKILSGKVFIVGIGPGHRRYILPAAVEAMEESDIIIGFKRAIESIDFVQNNKIQLNSLTGTIDFIKKNRDKVISVIASGDPSFYGISDYITRNYDGDVEIIPGISSFQYLFAKLKKSWQGVTLGSLHGREADFIKIVKNEKVSFWLTDKVNTPSTIASRLLEEGIKGIMHVGENLSYEDERIISAQLEEIVHKSFSELSVIIIEKEGE